MLSEAIRAIHIEEGRVEAEGLTLKCSVANKLFNYEFSVGDRVKFCRNEYRTLQVANGTIGTIKQIESLNNDARLVIELDNCREVSFLASEYSDEIGVNLCHAYALTVFSSQGTTVDGNTFILYNGQMDRANTYVALSRHKDKSHIYINKAEINEHLKAFKEYVEITDETRHSTLATLINQDSQPYLAIEYLKEEKQQAQKYNKNHKVELNY